MKKREKPKPTSTICHTPGNAHGLRYMGPSYANHAFQANDAGSIPETTAALSSRCRSRERCPLPWRMEPFYMDLPPARSTNRYALARQRDSSPKGDSVPV